MRLTLLFAAAAHPGYGGCRLSRRGAGAAAVAQLHAGKTLAQVADATPGKSQSGLVDALVSGQAQQARASVRGGQADAGAAGQSAWPDCTSA